MQGGDGFLQVAGQDVAQLENIITPGQSVEI